METSELLKKVRRVEIKTRRLTNQLFSGEYHSSFKGKGMSFAEVRKYYPGDDVRDIDWNVTAKLNEPYIKLFEEERELTLMLLVDVSESMNFGTDYSKKRDIMTEISAVLAFSAMQNNDKIGVIFFSDQIEKFIPPKKGKTHILRIIRELIEFTPTQKATNLSVALEYLSRVMKKQCITFVLSDFIDSDYEKTMQIAAKKYDLTGIRVYDKQEENLPSLGFIEWFDKESGNSFWVDTNSKKIQKEYRSNYLEYIGYTKSTLQKNGADYLEIRTDESYVKKLLAFFKRRS
jgi:uncharacterized protein (DUF58 family)